jgi:hypothetical protein
MPRRQRGLSADTWAPTRPLPWPKTGNPALDLLRAAVEGRLYPYGDVVSSPGRSVSSYQLQILAEGRAAGMDDPAVANFLSANLACGGSTIYERGPDRWEPRGYICFSGRMGPPDVMGRRGFSWDAQVTSRGNTEPTHWHGAELYAAFRRAFDIPFRAAPEPTPPGCAWEHDQGLLF